MTDFTKILDKAKELESKMKESQKKIKEIRVEGVSGSNSVKVILDGEGEMQSIKLSEEIMREDKSIIEDLIVAAHNSAKSQLKTKTAEEISKATGGLGMKIVNSDDIYELKLKSSGLGMDFTKFDDKDFERSLRFSIKKSILQFAS